MNKSIPSAFHSIFFDWHGILCSYERMRSGYRKGLFSLLQPLSAISYAEWETVEEEAYQKFLEVYNSYLNADEKEQSIKYSELIRKADEMYYEVIISRLHLEGQFSGESLPVLARKWEYQINSSYSCVPDSIRQYLEAFRIAGFSLFVTTSSSEAHISGSLTGAGVEDLFQAFFSAEALDAFKIHKKFWKHAFLLSGQLPETSIVVDDTEANLLIPAHLGAWTVLISSTSPAGNPNLHFPDFDAFAHWLLNDMRK